MAFCQRLLDETGVAITPGVDFDRERGSRTVRLSYCAATGDVEAAMDRLASFLRERDCALTPGRATACPREGGDPALTGAARQDRPEMAPRLRIVVRFIPTAVGKNLISLFRRPGRRVSVDPGPPGSVAPVARGPGSRAGVTV